MSEPRNPTKVRIASTKLQVACEAAKKKVEADRAADVEAAINVELNRPPARWWQWLMFETYPGPAVDRQEAFVRLQRTIYGNITHYTEIKGRYQSSIDLLENLILASQMNRNYVDVSIDDLWVFKDHFDYTSSSNHKV